MAQPGCVVGGSGARCDRISSRQPRGQPKDSIDGSDRMAECIGGFGRNPKVRVGEMLCERLAFNVLSQTPL